MEAALLGVGSAIGLALVGGLYHLGNTLGRLNQTVIDFDRRIAHLEAPVVAAANNLSPRPRR